EHGGCSTMRIGVLGCCHGELDRVYETVRKLERQSIGIDLLICCGDFMSVRNEQDLDHVCMPQQHRERQDMKDFSKYYTGRVEAPVTTIFVGGRNEAANLLREHYFGGWVAPRIYYLGCAGVVRIGPLRIAGISGNFVASDYFRGRHECPPFTEEYKRSAVHAREYDAARLEKLQEPIDIVVSYDWPRGIWKFGNYEKMCEQPDLGENVKREMEGQGLTMLRVRQHFGKPCRWAGNVGDTDHVIHTDRSSKGLNLASRVTGDRICLIVPTLILDPGPLPRAWLLLGTVWVLAYSREDRQMLDELRVKFPALVPHGDGTFTRFLALDRCRTGREYMQAWQQGAAGLRFIPVPEIMQAVGLGHRPALSHSDASFATTLLAEDACDASTVSANGFPDLRLRRLPVPLCYDAEWLAVQKVNHESISFSWQPAKAKLAAATREDVDWVKKRLRDDVGAVPSYRGRRHPDLLPTKLRKSRGAGRQTFQNFSTEQLRELYDFRGLVFPGHLDKPSMIKKLEEYDALHGEEEEEKAVEGEGFPIPLNFEAEPPNPQQQRARLLAILELHDLWKDQESQRRQVLRSTHMEQVYDPFSDASVPELAVPPVASAGPSHTAGHDVKPAIPSDEPQEESTEREAPPAATDEGTAPVTAEDQAIYPDAADAAPEQEQEAAAVEEAPMSTDAGGMGFVPGAEAAEEEDDEGDDPGPLLLAVDQVEGVLEALTGGEEVPGGKYTAFEAVLGLSWLVLHVSSSHVRSRQVEEAVDGFAALAKALAEAERPLDCDRFSVGRLLCEEAEAAEAAAVVVDVDAPAFSKTSQQWVPGIVREIWPDGSVHVQYEQAQHLYKVLAPELQGSMLRACGQIAEPDTQEEGGDSRVAALVEEAERLKATIAKQQEEISALQEQRQAQPAVAQNAHGLVQVQLQARQDHKPQRSDQARPQQQPLQTPQQGPQQQQQQQWRKPSASKPFTAVQPNSFARVAENREEENWTCSVCTFENVEPLTECEMCGTKRSYPSSPQRKRLKKGPPDIVEVEAVLDHPCRQNAPEVTAGPAEFLRCATAVIEPGIGARSASQVQGPEDEALIEVPVPDCLSAGPSGEPLRLTQTLHDRLCPYQREGVAWMWHLHARKHGGILADEMGLGKTVQACGMIRALRAKQATHVLVVMPVTLLDQWAQELKKWCPGCPVFIYHGSPTHRARALRAVARARGGVLLTSYAIIKNEDEKLAMVDLSEDAESTGLSKSEWRPAKGAKRARGMAAAAWIKPWDLVICDEAHVMRTISTLLGKAVRRLKADCRILLTGTPVQNALQDLWALMDFAQPGLLGNHATFTKRFNDPIEKGSVRDASPSAVALKKHLCEQLWELVRPHLLRRTKDRVGMMDNSAGVEARGSTEALTKPLPPRTEFVVWLVPSKDQVRIYQKALETSEIIHEANSKSKLGVEVFRAIGLLKRLCNHPALALPTHENWQRALATAGEGLLVPAELTRM
ncbi:dbr1, partial [Symbiodinium necroappetens]